MNKYRAIKTEIDGFTFHSKKEALHYANLKLLMHAGEILCLTLQPVYEIVINGQKICKVILDFEFLTKEGKKIIQDVKGMDTPVSKLKRRLVRAQYGIEVEVL